jgi:transglutaminase-like putative cysteine protease
MAFSALPARSETPAATPGQTSATPAQPAIQTYDIQQTVTVNDIPAKARNVRLWISIPDEGPAQRLLNLSVVDAPGSWQIVRDRDRGDRFLYVEINKPGKTELSTTLAFSVQRSAVQIALDPAGATALPDAQKALFAEELALDAPHMKVTDSIRKTAREVCGTETNPVHQVRRLLDYVADTADHYSKNPKVPNCGVGDAGNCIANGGGCCTDLHSLFIALARATGIPSRLQMGYRLQPKNAGVEADPGYRCWVEYFIAGYGWIPADIVEADAGDAAARTRWFTGLTERRLHLNQGREFDLPFKRNKARVNHMSIGYAEIDGTPARVLPEGTKTPQLVRKVKYTERATPAAVAVSAAGKAGS